MSSRLARVSGDPVSKEKKKKKRNKKGQLRKTLTSGSHIHPIYHNIYHTKKGGKGRKEGRAGIGQKHGL